MNPVDKHLDKIVRRQMGREDPDLDKIIEHIAEVSRNARTTWFALLGFLAFVGITLLGVEDADFFAYGRQTALPLVGVEIPTRSFFFVAPALLAILHVYLQIYLLKLWDALATAPPKMPDGTHLSARIYPWLISDMALALRRDEAAPPRPMQGLTKWAMLLLVWIAAPAVLGVAWWRSMPAHNEWLTLWIAAWLALATVVSASGYFDLRRQMQAAPRTPGNMQIRWPLSMRLTTVAVTLVLATTSWLRTEGGLEHYVSDVHEGFTTEGLEARLGIQLLAPIDLIGVQLVPRPADWKDHQAAKEDFRDNWCPRDRGGCTLSDETEAQLERRWAASRDATLNTLPALDLRGADLRGASMSSAFLPVVDLRGARMEGAVLRRAQMEGAILQGAQIAGADLGGVRMEEADLRGSQMEGAVLTSARMEGADLTRAQMEGTVLIKAQMEGAILRSAQMEGADLREAQMEGADLTLARMEGADLTRVRMEGAHLNSAQMEHVDLSGANLRSANLEGWYIDGAALRSVDFTSTTNWTDASFASAFGHSSTVLPEGAQRPAHWPDLVVTDDGEFYGRWRGWRETNGMSWPPPGRRLAWLGVRYFRPIPPDTPRQP
ncbi:MAG: pentapeptide repeat-containing protein [Pseudomonadota bacterium]